MDDNTNYYLCESCEGSFKISHSLDPNLYQIKICPFCGAEDLIEDLFIDDEEL